MKIIVAFYALVSFSVMANYQINSENVDGVTMTTNKEPAAHCTFIKTYQFKSKAMARDEKRIIAETKRLKGNYVVESYDNYPSPTHYGKVYKCP